MNNIKDLMLTGPRSRQQSISYMKYIKSHIKDMNALQLTNDEMNIIIGHLNTCKLVLTKDNSTKFFFGATMNALRG